MPGFENKIIFELESVGDNLLSKLINNYLHVCKHYKDTFRYMGIFIKISRKWKKFIVIYFCRKGRHKELKTNIDTSFISAILNNAWQSIIMMQIGSQPLMFNYNCCKLTFKTLFQKSPKQVATSLWINVAKFGTVLDYRFALVTAFLNTTQMNCQQNHIQVFLAKIIYK